MKDERKRRSNLAIYAVIMILMLVIVIIVAAMADDREKGFQNRINETAQTNQTISDEIVKLKDENYKLTRENQALKDTESARKDFNKKMTDALNKFKEGDLDGAAELLSEINRGDLPEDLLKFYDALVSAAAAVKLPQ